jgi:hypothetical protein
MSRPIEFAAMAPSYLAGLDGWRSLAARTGLNLEAVASLGVSNNLGVLFGADGRLRDSAELRSMEATGVFSAPTVRRAVQQKLVDLFELRWPAAPQTHKQRVCELMRRRGEWTWT